ncbi:hypothetical protein PHYC_02811 [Phycisphaerales bacterium]|nr:hypothetical protein PHYC_02811 [Phycisphaerales bacterium]
MTRLVWTIPVLAAMLALLPACGSAGPRDTPEETIAAMKKVVLDGRADRLGDFIYADNPDMRKLLRRTGIMLGNLQKLSASVQAKFPDEVAKLKADAVQAAKDGKATSFLSQIVGQIGGNNAPRRRRASSEDSNKVRASFDDFLKGLMADPYGWAEQAETRLTTAFLTDDSVALLWDEKPVLAPIGLKMQRAVDGEWYIVLPTGAVGGLMPHTPDQYKIFGSLIATFDNVIIDLATDVESGRVNDLNELSRKAGEKAFLPVAATVFAYGNYTAKLEKEKRAAAKPTAGTSPASSSPSPK